jgi:hypothetical protein
MRSTAVVDDLILWHGVAIVVLAWLITATASLDGLLPKPGYASSAKSPMCMVRHGCDSSMRWNWQLDRP